MRLRASVAQALKRLELGRQPFRRLGEGRLFESLREWVPGDDLRHIDWKATAKRRKVITRQYEAERRQQVLLVLDTGRLLTAEIAGGSRRSPPSGRARAGVRDRKSTRLNSSHLVISYSVFCFQKKNIT